MTTRQNHKPQQTCCKQCSNFVRILDHYRYRGSRVVECRHVIGGRMLYHSPRSQLPPCKYYTPRYIGSYVQRIILSETYEIPHERKKSDEST